MKTLKFACGLTLLSLTACGDPPGLRIPMDALLQECVIEGKVRTRSDAVTNGDLWNFAGQAEAAVIRCNRDKELLREGLQQPQNESTRRWWEFWK